jgi:hypothetical protein
MINASNVKLQNSRIYYSGPRNVLIGDDDVSEEIGQAGCDEFVMLLGDLNGHVGANAEGYEGVHGGFGYGVRNEEGCRVLELGPGGCT